MPYISLNQIKDVNSPRWRVVHNVLLFKRHILMKILHLFDFVLVLMVQVASSTKYNTLKKFLLIKMEMNADGLKRIRSSTQHQKMSMLKG